MLVLLRNHLNCLKDSIFECFLKELFLKKVFQQHVLMENLSLEEANIIKDIKNLFRPKK